MNTPEQTVSGSESTAAVGDRPVRRKKVVRSKAVPHDKPVIHKHPRTARKSKAHVAKPTGKRASTTRTTRTRPAAVPRPTLWSRFWDGLGYGTSATVGGVTAGVTGINSYFNGVLHGIGARMQDYHDEMIGTRPIPDDRNIVENTVLHIGKWTVTIIGGTTVLITNSVKFLTIMAADGAVWLLSAAFASVVEASNSFVDLLVSVKNFLTGEGYEVTEERKGSRVRFTTAPAT